VWGAEVFPIVTRTVRYLLIIQDKLALAKYLLIIVLHF